MSYFILYAGEDGFSVEKVDKDTLLKRLNDNYYGCIEDLISSHFPNDRDPNYWGKKLIIIKGHVVVPSPVKTVEVWEVP